MLTCLCIVNLIIHFEQLNSVAAANRRIPRNEYPAVGIKLKEVSFYRLMTVIDRFSIFKIEIVNKICGVSPSRAHSRYAC